MKKPLDNNYVIAAIIGLISILLVLFSNILLATILKSLANITTLKPVSINISDAFNFQLKYKLYYMIVVCMISFVDIKFIYIFKVNFKNINKGQKGNSEFTTLKELKEQYKAIPEKGKTYAGGGGVIISRYKKKIFIDDSPVNNLIIGTTRSGKGETFVFPTIDVYSRAEKKPSMIINDPKGELAAASYDTLKKRGYDIQILNLMTPDNSMSYNPLQLVIDAYKAGDYSTAQLLCNTLTFSLYNDPTAKDKFWSESAQSLVNALILAITKDCIESNEENKITLYTVANLLSELGSREDEDGNNELDLFFQRRDSSDIAKMQYASSNFAKGTTRGGIFSSAMTKLQIFTFDEIARMTSRNSYDLEKIGFGEKPVVIFMVVPDYDSSNHVIASIFIRQSYFVLAKKATMSKGRKCKREVVYLLDEFGNMPPIEGLANIITVCLGRNIRFNLIIQAFSQLKKFYGDDETTIINNCGNKIYILTSDYSTAKRFSDDLGNKTQIIQSVSGRTLSLQKSNTDSLDRSELMTPNDLMSLKEGETVVIRVIKRQDKKRNRIKPKPIYNTGKTALKYRYEYLSKDFDTDKDLNDIEISSNHRNVILKDLLFTAGYQDEYEYVEEEKESLGQAVQNKQLSKRDKFLIQKILRQYEALEDIDIVNSEQSEIEELIAQYTDVISFEDSNEITKILKEGES